MRVSSLFNTILDVPGASVRTVSLCGDDELVIELQRRRKTLVCPCGARSRRRHDSSRRRWRHLDFGVFKVFLEAEIRRVNCQTCGRVQTEVVPWARGRARHTREFENQIGWMAQRIDKTTVSRLLRCSWEAVDRIARRLVGEYLDDSRFEGLRRIGVDEISYKRGHKYLTVVANHDTGRVVWVSQDRTKASFERFFQTLGPERVAVLEAITLDASSIYKSVAAEQAPQAQLCVDPFHVIKWCNEALDALYRSQPALPELSKSGVSFTTWRRLRYALLAGAERLAMESQDLIRAVRRHNRRVYRGWELKEELRELYRTVDPKDAANHLKKWCKSALLSRIPSFRNLAKRIKRHLDAIVASVTLRLSNSLLEGINAKIRVIQRRGYGHPAPESLTSMIYLCLSGITVKLPTET